MQDGVSAVNDIVEVLRVDHGGGVLDMKLDAVLDSGLLLCEVGAVLLCQGDHVDREVDAMHKGAKVPGHVEGRAADAASHIQHLRRGRSEERCVSQSAHTATGCSKEIAES